jgi:hypothetical protein
LNLTAEQLAEKRQAAFTERMMKLTELDAVVAKTLTMKPHTVEVAPVKK